MELQGELEGLSGKQMPVGVNRRFKLSEGFRNQHLTGGIKNMSPFPFSSPPPGAAAAARECNVQGSRRLAFSQAEKLLISVHHTFRGRCS